MIDMAPPLLEQLTVRWLLRLFRWWLLRLELQARHEGLELLLKHRLPGLQQVDFGVFLDLLPVETAQSGENFLAKLESRLGGLAVALHVPPTAFHDSDALRQIGPRRKLHRHVVRRGVPPGCFGRCRRRYGMTRTLPPYSITGLVFRGGCLWCWPVTLRGRPSPIQERRNFHTGGVSAKLLKAPALQRLFENMKLSFLLNARP